MSSEKKLTLVGAGPGDPSLITLKAVEALKNADALLYDALVHPSLLDYVPEGVPRIFVGKRSGNHYMKQEEINRLILDKIREHGHVVRLKGGDPFIFGRGYEEIIFIKSYGFGVEVVPGVSSCTSLPTLQHIPLTTRGINRSFWVVTATASTGELSEDLQLAAQSSATIVILMGLKKLPEIVALFKKYDKEDLPIAIIQNGSWENEFMITGRISTIEAVVAHSNIGTPAIMVIGETVGLHPNFEEQTEY